ncbi:zinc finger protein 501-like, partial [Protopterus annectens]|uniref:zinc finger protein 501-like n=1 Tax=Protopterus annectens TaxID=7888 RepID=UPI001CF95736
MKLEVPERFEDVAVEFSREEWEMLSEKEKKLHQEVMVQNFDHMIDVGYNIPVDHLWSLILKDKMLPSGIGDTGMTLPQNQLPGNRISISRDADFSEIQNLRPSHEKLLDAEFNKALSDKMSITRENGMHSETRNNCKESDDGLIKKNKREMHLQIPMEMACNQLNHSNSVTFNINDLTDQLSHNGKRQNNTMASHDQIGNKEKLYNCAICGKSFKSRQAITRHMLIHTGQKPYKCTMCDKRFTRRSSMISHQRTHSGQKPYKCSLCDKRFAWKRTMVLHQYIHTGHKPYKCTMCDKSFTLKSSMVKHQHIHTGEKPYKCTICNKSFVQKSHMVTHQSTHTGQKNYKCDTCGKSFRQKGNMYRHQNTHTGLKPYKCTMCDKSFSQKCSMTLHQHTHTGQKPFKCALCYKSFRQANILKRHQRIHSGQDPNIVKILKHVENKSKMTSLL